MYKIIILLNELTYMGMKDDPSRILYNLGFRWTKWEGQPIADQVVAYNVTGPVDKPVPEYIHLYELQDYKWQRVIIEN